MKIYITGIAGFIGSNLANELYDEGHYVRGCDNLQFGYLENINPKIEWSRMDFDKCESEHLNEYNCLVHCATANIIYSQKNPIETFKTNALKTINLFEKYHGKIIYTSTASVYGNAYQLPTKETDQLNVYNAYDQSKLIAERYLKLRGDYTTLRLSNVYGINQRPENPYSGVIAKFIHSDKLQIYGDGLDTRDFTYITDTTAAIKAAIVKDSTDTEINISSGIETSIINVAFHVCTEMGKHFDADFIEKRQIDGIQRRWLDISKASELLDYKPQTSIKQGIKITIENYLKNNSI